MKKIAYLSLAALVAVGLAAYFPALAQTTTNLTCDIVPGTRVIGYIGGAGSDAYLAKKDNVENDISLQTIHLRGLGANFYGTSNYPVTSNQRMTAAAADFNLDGMDDLVQGGRGCDNNADAADTNLSIHVSEGLDPADPTRFKFKSASYIHYLPTISGGTYEMMGLGAGDLDKDGDPDIVAIDWRGVVWIFWNRFKEHAQTPGAAPDIDAVPTPILGTVAASDVINDGYGEYGSNTAYWRWETNIAVSDFDNDGDLDVFVAVPTYRAITRYGEVVVFVNNGTGTFSLLTTKAASFINPYPNTGLPNGIYGACGIATGDYNNDNKLDFVVCSVSDKNGKNPDSRMYYYAGDGLGGFKVQNTKTITFQYVNSYGFPNYMAGADLDSDGDRDFVMGTDGYLSSPQWQGGYVNWYRNEGTGLFTKIAIPSSGAKVSSSGDLDSGAVGDFDGDGDPDFFVADGNDSLKCYFFMNNTFPIYVAQGTAWSRNRLDCAFLDSENALVNATITVNETKPAATSITYYLSNSNDEAGVPKWEGPVTPGVKFWFTAPGNFLRWKAVLASTNNLVTPSVRRIDLDYEYLTKREYSRTSQTLAMVDIGGTADKEEVLYSASFEFPKWRGHLRSWDVSNLNLTYTKNSEIKDIKTADAVLLHDAAEVMNAKSWSARTIYTAYDAEDDQKYNNRLPFTLAQRTTLDDYLGVGEASPEVDPLIQFVLGYDVIGARERPWKLGDINHSSPQALLPPNAKPTLMGAGYEAFMNDNADRPKVIIVGANDGMLHCFDPVSLDELWGFIPNNLLPKLRRMHYTDPDCGEYVSHEYFVDGTPAISDVFYGGDWHTVVVCGQGAGWGRDNLCYYFCLDVTDPMNPKPMWEFTDADTIGQTWSTPAIGRLANGRWVAFFGSGYDSNPTEAVGNRLYCVDIETGEALATMTLSQGKETSPFGIQNTLPGGPAVVDLNSDGNIDVVFIGDLLGRMWRVDIAGTTNGWNPEVIFTDPFNAPIITKPAVDLNTSEQYCTLYFGTGGDEAAPNDGYYSFIALKSFASGAASVSWYLGLDEFATKLGISLNYKKGSLGLGEKVWADPVASNHIVYIATLFYSIENLNPCLTLTGSGKIYARYTIGDRVGSSALLGMTGEAIESLNTKQKVRSAVVLGEVQSVASGDNPAVNKQKVFIQDYTAPAGEGPEPPSEVLALSVQQTRLLIKSWREVYRIIR
ncbi:MAG TPA: PilC/PilY family type IV pilus protein [Candidatus Bathyarchaeia archaeon]|nr:PilC/PilY family type IV pilus protein [Candidatus Bathyarchaeia archaeon]